MHRAMCPANLTMQTTLLKGNAPSVRLNRAGRRNVVVVRAHKEEKNVFVALSQKAAALSLAATMALAPVSAAVASEIDILAEDEPKSGYIIDDAGVLSKSTSSEVNNILSRLEKEKGFKVTVITTRKLEFDPDAFAFGEKILRKWSKGAENAESKGIFLVVTTAKDGAVVGGDKFIRAVGDDLIDAVIGGNVSVLAGEEKYNETVTSSLNRIVSVIEGKADPGGPVRDEGIRKRTYKTKEETEKTKSVTGTIVLTLLFIAFVVPMLQFYGYVGGSGR